MIGNTKGLYEGDLKHYFQLMFNSAQNLRRPYHNLRHMLHVTWQCYNGCQFHQDELTPLQMRHVVVAASLHNIDHPGMLGHDDLNIERAIRALRKHAHPDDRDHLASIEMLIRATQFPHVIANEALDLCGHIIRDADMTQALEPVWIQETVIGLATEWGKSPLEVLRTQEGFLRQLKFRTAWAKTTFPAEAIEAKIEECRQLLKFLAEPSTT